MRLTFFILLLANVLVLAYFLLLPKASGNGARPPLRPEAIRIAGQDSGTPPPPGRGAARCLEWTGVPAADLPRLRAALQELGLGDKLVFSGGTEYWVHVSGLNGRTEAEKKLAELRALGVTEGTVVETEGKGGYALSLAAFATAAEAESYLGQLRAKGVKSARVVERQLPGSGITLIRLDEAEVAKVERLRASYDKAELRPVECRLP